MFLEWSFIHKIQASLERPVRGRYGNLPANMIHSPNCFSLPCAVPFHKIIAGYEATSVSSSCLIYSYYFDAILLNWHVIKALTSYAYAHTHVRMRVAAFYNTRPTKISAKIILLNVGIGCTIRKIMETRKSP